MKNAQQILSLLNHRSNDNKLCTQTKIKNRYLKKKYTNQSQCHCTVNENKKFKIVTSVDMDSRTFL